MKWVKRLGIGIGVLVILMVAAIAIISATFDPNEYKPRIAQLVQERYARTLAMDGPIALTFLPRLGASISKVSLSEAHATNNFAKVGAAHVSVALLPLFSRKVVVDRIELRDVEANLVKHADGKTNFDDLAGPAKPAAAGSTGTGSGDTAASPVAIDIDGVRIENLAIGWKDEAAKTDLRLLDINLELGRIASGATGNVSFSARAEGKQPKLDARLQIAGSYRLALDTVPGRKVEFPELNITVAMKERDLAVQAKLGAAIAVELDAKALSLAKVASEVTATGAAVPNGSLKVAMNGSASVHWEKRTLAADLTMKFDESTARINLNLADYAKPDPRFKLDIDRYTGKGQPATAKSATAKPPAGGTGKGDGADAPIYLSALKAVNGAGSIHIGSLVAANVTAEKIAVDVKAAGGEIHLDPIKAQLYSGSVAGAINVDARSNRFVVRQQLANVAVGPLLRDAAGVDMLEGRGSVSMDITTNGGTVGELKRALNGKAQLNLQDGAVKGLNLADVARRARALRSGDANNAAAGAADKTDFSELTASFIIRNGIARNDDLSMKAPFVRVTGAGRIDVPAGTIDYLAKPALAATTTGHDGRSADEVRSITLPVIISGPFDQLRYSIDLGSVAKDAAKEAVQRQLGERAKGALEGAGKERIGDVLKGILGR